MILSTTKIPKHNFTDEWLQTFQYIFMFSFQHLIISSLQLPWGCNYLEDGFYLQVCCMDLKGLHMIRTWSSSQLLDIIFMLKLLGAVCFIWHLILSLTFYSGKTFTSLIHSISQWYFCGRTKSMSPRLPSTMLKWCIYTSDRNEIWFSFLLIWRQ